MKAEIDVKITEIFNNRGFTLSAEVMPPRNGTGLDGIFSQIEGLIGAGARYLSVTKGAGGSLRAGSLPLAQAINLRFQKPCVAHFTCRDLLPEEVENQLIDHHLFGIRNILALRGDPPEGNTDWRPRNGSHTYAYQLVEQIRELNHGKFLERKGYKTEDRHPTEFCIGVACYPDHPIAKERLEFFERKIDAGAEFAISQMIFDPDSYAQFLDLTSHCHVPVLPGTRLLKSKDQARRMAQKFNVKLSAELLRRLPETDGESNPDQTTKAFLWLTDTLKKFGAPGIHLFVMSDASLAIQNFRHLAASVDAKPKNRLDQAHDHGSKNGLY